MSPESHAEQKTRHPESQRHLHLSTEMPSDGTFAALVDAEMLRIDSRQ